MMRMDDDVVLVSGARTAIGKFGGSLKEIDAHLLGATAIKAALERATVPAEEVDAVVMGQVGSVGPDAFNARRCQLAAGIPPSAVAMNVNRLCSSGLQAIVSGAYDLWSGHANLVVAGGDENMSRQPFLDYHARDGWRLGHHEVIDGTLSLVTDPFGDYPMGATAERVAAVYGVSREDQDAFAAESQRRALAAIDAGVFAQEIAPVEVPRAETPFAIDEHPRRGVTAESLARLRPAFQFDGTVTAGNSSGINDAAAAVVMMRASEAARRGLRARLVLRAWSTVGVEPDVMGYAPALAIPAVLKDAGLSLDAIDHIELNEAFAAQALAVIRGAALDAAKVNPNGGAIALGHPVGATGALLTVKLMYALERARSRFGIVTMCVGGGQAMAAVFERPAD